MTAIAEPRTALPDRRRRPVRPRGPRGPAAVPRRAARRRAGRAPDAATTSTPWPATSRCTPRWSTGRRFQSGAGVGLSNFRYEKPWRPPSLLLEADPPHHDAPRRVLAQDPRPARAAPAARAVVRRRRGPRRRWSLAEPELEFDAVAGARRGVPAAGVPRRRRHPRRGPGEPAALRRPRCSTPSARPTTWSRRARRAIAELSGVGQRAVRPRGAGPDDGLRRRRSGPPPTAATSRPSRRRWSCARCSPPASTPPSTASAAVLYALRHPPRASGSGCARDPTLARVAFDEAVRWESPVQTFFRTADRRRPRSATPSSRRARRS